MYIGWFCDDPKKTTADKINDARKAYIARFGCEPNVCLVHDEKQTREAIPGMTIRMESYVREHNFLVGLEVSSAETRSTN